MPWVGYERWERQLLTTKPYCLIPLSDEAAWAIHYSSNWVYNKLELTRRQNIACAPHGVVPGFTPVFSKPMTNLWGMSSQAEIVGNPMCEDGHFREDIYRPGHFIMPVLHGPETSSDVVMVSGKIVWHASWQAEKTDGAYSYWHRTHHAPKFALKRLEKLLPSHTGALTMEVINGVITDLGLRPTPQWIDMYGPNWQRVLCKLYDTGTWETPSKVPDTGYSCVLYSPFDRPHRVDFTALNKIKPLVQSVQLTFDARPLSEQFPHRAPYRVALVNGFDLWKCKKAVEMLARHAIVSD